MGPRWGQRDPISKIHKSLIHIGGPSLHSKFQHSSSIRKCLKIGGTEMLLLKERRHTTDPTSFLRFSKCHKNLNERHFDTRIFAIRSCVFTKEIEVF